jgi:hypothetical protein
MSLGAAAKVGHVIPYWQRRGAKITWRTLATFPLRLLQRTLISLLGRPQVDPLRAFQRIQLSSLLEIEPRATILISALLNVEFQPTACLSALLRGRFACGVGRARTVCRGVPGHREQHRHQQRA